jgi:hypothetical protein
MFSKLKKLKSGVTLLMILAAFAGMFASFKGGQNSVEGGADTVMVSVTDTIRSLEIRYTQLPGTIDSIMVPVVETNTDTIMVYTEVATLDTLLNEGQLNVAYSPRFNWFDVHWQPYPVTVTYDSIVHTYKVDLTNAKAFTILGGSGYSFGDRAFIGVGASMMGYSLLYEQSAEDSRIGIWKSLGSF